MPHLWRIHQRINALYFHLFSAKLIDALFTAEPLSSLILYISLTVGLTFLFTVLNQWISSVQTKAEDAVYRAEAWMYSEKQ